MGFFKILFNVIKILFRINLFKTLYFNFKVLPFEKAIKLPIHFYGKVELVNLKGKFSINKEKVNFGMIVFGGKHEIVISSNVATRIYNSGSIVFDGDARFARGINIMVWDNGILSVGTNFSIGSLSRIICFRKISFGNDVLISWETQIVDTDFHFIISKGNQVNDSSGEVYINDAVWIGSRATILKNTILPNNAIVAAQSLCSGNYSEKYGSGILLAGIPAKLLRSEVEYLKNKKKELELFQYFSAHHNDEINLNN
jgi:acetyltransferase-like isoleucine patch superfamily enzyme